MRPTPRGSDPPRVLDIGCGTGTPLTRRLASCGATVTGLDISERMLEKARRNVPEAAFIRCDVAACPISGAFDGVLAWDSLFHVPLNAQMGTLRKVLRSLRADGVALFTTGAQHGEVVSEMLGQAFYYSSLAAEQYDDILAEEDCRVLYAEVDDPGGHGHRVICCQRTGPG